MKKIAILGATGYIGKSLTEEFVLENDKYKIFLFSRSKEKLKDFMNSFLGNDNCKVCLIEEFNRFDYDVVINCTGIGDPAVWKRKPCSIFKVTEEIDNLIIGYLEKKPKTLYINLSSGAVYCNDFKKPINIKTKTSLNMNNISVSDYYSVAKINSEVKHRSLSNLNIVDLRIFAFFSHFVDLGSSFLMSEIANCIKNKKVFNTNDANIVRDYICSKDLFSVVEIIIKKEKINDFFDVYSKKPISKFELLSFLEKKYGLKYLIKETIKFDKKISKNVYFSKNRKLKDLGNEPKFTSLEGIEFEIDKILSK